MCLSISSNKSGLYDSYKKQENGFFFRPLITTTNDVDDPKILKLDCAVCALRKRYFEPEFNLEKRFQQKMKNKRIKAQLNRIIFLFKPASKPTEVDKLLEEEEEEEERRQQHEMAMEELRQERIVKIDRMYCLLERRAAKPY